VTAISLDGTLMLRRPVKHCTLFTLFIGHGFHNMHVNIYAYTYVYIRIRMRVFSSYIISKRRLTAWQAEQ